MSVKPNQAQKTSYSPRVRPQPPAPVSALPRCCRARSRVGVAGCDGAQGSSGRCRRAGRARARSPSAARAGPPTPSRARRDARSASCGCETPSRRESGRRAGPPSPGHQRRTGEQRQQDRVAPVRSLGRTDRSRVSASSPSRNRSLPTSLFTLAGNARTSPVTSQCKCATTAASGPRPAGRPDHWSARRSAYAQAGQQELLQRLSLRRLRRPPPQGCATSPRCCAAPASPPPRQPPPCGVRSTHGARSRRISAWPSRQAPPGVPGFRAMSTRRAQRMADHWWWRPGWRESLPPLVFVFADTTAAKGLPGTRPATTPAPRRVADHGDGLAGLDPAHVGGVVAGEVNVPQCEQRRQACRVDVRGDLHQDAVRTRSVSPARSSEACSHSRAVFAVSGTMSVWSAPTVRAGAVAVCCSCSAAGSGSSHLVSHISHKRERTSARKNL